MHNPIGTARLALAALGILTGAQVLAQASAPGDGTCPRTRAEVRAECREFLATHRWDEGAGDYVPKAGAKGKGAAIPPEGVKTRAEVRAERDSFLRANRWNDASSQWEPVGATPRDLSKLSRAEVQKETRAFLRTHRWDEATQAYVDRPARGKGKAG